MNSSAFSEFKKDMYSSTQVKRHGYNLSLLAKMNHEELLEIERLLINELSENSFPVQALLYISTDSALSALKNKWESISDSMKYRNYELGIAVAKLNGSPNTLEVIVKNFSDLSEIDQISASSQIAELDAGISRDALLKLVFQDNRTVKSIAGKVLLNKKRALLDDASYKELLQILKGEDSNLKQSILADL